MSVETAVLIASINGDNLSPKISESSNYKHWVSIEDLKRCIVCASYHGKIWLMAEIPKIEPPVHPNCRCAFEVMKAIAAGTATINGMNGADWCLKHEDKLPNYYATKEEAEAAGWKPGKWPSNFIPNKMITRGRYYNDDGHLPSSTGRIWYEADINYKSGRRNTQRILWSNDGLIFVTYDHYETFYEIV